MTDARDSRRERPRRPSATLAALLGWLLPGLGQAYLGRPVKALLFLAVIGGTYALGLSLSGYLCVDPVRDPVWFAAQALAGGPTAAAWWWTRGLLPVERIPTYDVGLLYVTVAALLNAVAVADALGTVDEIRRRNDDDAARRAAEDEARARAEAEAALPPPFEPAAADGPLVLPDVRRDADGTLS